MEKLEPMVVWLPFGAAQRLARAFDVTPKAVSEAINGRSSSDLSRRIRYTAVKEFGGVTVKYSGCFCPNCDTVRAANGDMESVFTDRVKVVYNAHAQLAAVYIDGEIRETASVKSIADYMNFERRVQDVADTLQ